MGKGDLVGNLAVVTGGGSGIGRGICQVFAREGCTVVAAGRTPEKLEETVKQLAGTGHCAVPVDVTSRQSVVSLFSTIKDRYNRVPDVIVNCAGIWKSEPLLKHTDEDFEDLFNVYVKGPFMMTQEGCRHMIEEKLKAGSIINMSSISGTRAHPDSSLYSATNGAVESFTRAAALEMAPHGIRVNAVSPGAVNTPMLDIYFKIHPEHIDAAPQMIPLGKIAEPQEVGEVCAFLASAKSSYMTGSVVAVNGGVGI